MIPSPTVTIAMPAYNAEHTIGEAIRSVLAQTRQDFELVICDDASTDGTAGVVRAFTDSRIRLIVNDKNLGIGPNRDRAVAMATGRWVTVLDDDDVFMLDRMEKLLAVAEAHPDALVFDEIMDCHDTPNGLVPWRPEHDARTFRHSAGCTNPVRVRPADWIIASRTMMKPIIPTEAVRKHGIRHIPPRYCGDLGFVLSFLALTHAPMWYVPEPLYLWRITPGSGSTASDRYTLIAETLENAIPLFDWEPSMQEAMRRKAATVRRAETYQRFFAALMHGQVREAKRELLAHPWVISEFTWRSLERIPYHISRLRHGGARRETT